MKQTWKPGTMLSPLPPALITSGDMTHPNVMTAAWTGIICSDPVITYVSLRPSRYTHELITKNKEFVINLPTWKEARAVDTVGVKSGRNEDKFALTGLTPEPSSQLSAPQIKECPVSIECKVLEIRPFGTHDMFLAEVVAVNVDDQYINEDGALDLEKAGLLAYAHGFYYTLGRKIGKFGFSVEKKKKTPLCLTTKKLSLKADAKFGKTNKVPQLSSHEKENVSIKNGLDVVVRKPRLSKKEPADFSPKASLTFKKKSRKFSKKENKTTSFSLVSYKKKSDGSFKKKRAV